jgi:hypothetical protein
MLAVHPGRAAIWCTPFPPPTLALEVYAKKMARSRDTGERMDALIRGVEKAQKGANGSGPFAAFSLEKTKSAD